MEESVASAIWESPTVMTMVSVLPSVFPIVTVVNVEMTPAVPHAVNVKMD